MTEIKKIAYLGLGIMGRGMAENLVKADYEVTVWNRTAARCHPLVEQGATQAATPAEAATGADLIMYCLSNDTAVEETVFGDEGVLAGVRPDQIAVDMSTVSPATSRREAAAYAGQEVQFLDAPVFGSKNEAVAGGLWIVVGGPKTVVKDVTPVFGALGETIHHMGGHGQGASMKLVGNLIVAAQLEALGEAMILAVKAGLNPDIVLDVLQVTDFSSPIFAGVGHTLLKRDFSTQFALNHMLKDVNLISHLAEELQAPIPATSIIRENIKAAVNEGWGEENASALIKALETQAVTIVGKENL